MGPGLTGTGFFFVFSKKRLFTSDLICFAPQAAYAARYACSGRENINIMGSARSMIVSANWRLENAKSPASMLQENNPDTTRMGIPRMYLVS